MPTLTWVLLYLLTSQNPYPPSPEMLIVKSQKSFADCVNASNEMWNDYWVDGSSYTRSLWTYCAYADKRGNLSHVHLIKCGKDGECNE